MSGQGSRPGHRELMVKVWFGPAEMQSVHCNRPSNEFGPLSSAVLCIVNNIVLTRSTKLWLELGESRDSMRTIRAILSKGLLLMQLKLSYI